ncbi:MAG: VPLPA-CTERM sorting domain-containing protein [Planctomycetota bacterium]
MKTVAMLAAAGLAASATAQDTIVTIAPAGGSSWSITAEFSGDTSNVVGFTGILNVWSEARFTLDSTDGVLSNFSFNQAYVTSPFGAPNVQGDGTGSIRVDATAPGRPSAAPDQDSSNPLDFGTFDYTGTADGLTAALVDQNSIVFSNTNPFADANELYQTSDGSPGSRVLEFVIVPAPASAALLGLGGLVAARRRR